MGFCSGFRAQYCKFPFPGWNNVATKYIYLCFYVRKKNTMLTYSSLYVRATIEHELKALSSFINTSLRLRKTRNKLTITIQSSISQKSCDRLNYKLK